jgi:hypothetical protein
VFKSEVLQALVVYRDQMAILETIQLLFKSTTPVLHWMGLCIVDMPDLRDLKETPERLELQQQLFKSMTAVLWLEVVQQSACEQVQQALMVPYQATGSWMV